MSLKYGLMKWLSNYIIQSLKLRKNLERGDTPNPENKEMDEHFTAMTGLEMDSNRGFKFVLTEDGNYDIEKLLYTDMIQYISIQVYQMLGIYFNRFS